MAEYARSRGREEVSLDLRAHFSVSAVRCRITDL
jgi:hypothetical protein